MADGQPGPCSRKHTHSFTQEIFEKDVDKKNLESRRNRSSGFLRMRPLLNEKEGSTLGTGQGCSMAENPHAWRRPYGGIRVWESLLS